ncbi:protease complex subunit PrcB family protein [Flavobacterium sp. KACC 22761]|uniref:protease complex subunit PrcB family protein n=1 Tax=Flavobacterium sp. KACC 22761 TaxID=3092665 RepID=UPI002A74D108|nr:protease complex subunit PrcB family protein [Flavobacterium sp. KACC 22761]WPO79956.1 protease complex subunit PrcB family protein [Flavobacterium sp. KACC 22761]
MKRLILFLSFVLTCASCSNDNDDGSNIAFTTIIQTDHYGGTSGTIPQSNLVITNQTDWNNLQEKLNILTLAIYTSPDMNVDFTKQQVIAVFDQVRNSGGYSIDITKITQSNNLITVKVEQLKKGDLTSVITQPFHIVKMAKSSKPVVFK